MRQNSKIFVFFAFEGTFCQSATMDSTKVEERACSGFLQHPTKFRAQILTGNIFLKKIKKSAMSLSQFLGLYLPTTPQPLRLES